MFEKILFGTICLSGVILLVNRFVLGNKYDKKNPKPESIPVDYSRSLFPVLLMVFLLRGFIAEPFRIPSSSMLPTLEIGDFLFVNKFKYGVPENPAQNYIKRVIGLPGDVVEYKNKYLFVNGQRLGAVPEGDYTFTDATLYTHQTKKYEAGFANGVKHDMLINPQRGSGNGRWKVPAGHYFAMGDNRDHSADSRYWGFVD